MLILALDTSMAACSVCVYDADRNLVLGQRHKFMERGQAEALAPMVQETMKIAGVDFADLRRIAVTIGPGTFTGVRIGLAMARGLGVSLSIPIIGINSLAAIAANEKLNDQPIAVAADARMDEIYFAAFDRAGHELSPPAVLPLDDVQMPASPCLVLGTGADLLLKKLGRHPHLRSSAGDMPNAANFVRIAATMPADANPPEPLYLRAPDVKPQAAKLSFSGAGPPAAKLLAEIHGECFVQRWDEGAFAALLNSPGANAIVISNQNAPAGFVLFRKAADEAEIITLCTRPALRRRGHAKALVLHMETLLRKDGIKSLFIEVAISNQSALALYVSRGFTKAGVRKNYYDLGDGMRDDALIMRKGL
jgi:tRNA threonylcarbamoyladenosine biosynthesis protein TsaB